MVNPYWFCIIPYWFRYLLGSCNLKIVRQVFAYQVIIYSSFTRVVHFPLLLLCWLLLLFHISEQSYLYVHALNCLIIAAKFATSLANKRRCCPFIHWSSMAKQRVNSLFETVSNYGCILLSVECHLAANNFSVFPLFIVFFENRTGSIFQLSKYFCIMRICTYLAATSAWNVYAEMAVS